MAAIPARALPVRKGSPSPNTTATSSEATRVATKASSCPKSTAIVSERTVTGISIS